MENKKRNDYIRTFTGKEFILWGEDRTRVFDAKDIAHGLSHTNRYNGHRGYAPVSAHCLRVSDRMFEACHTKGLPAINFALIGLLHDAAEAYIGDMVSPLKQFVPQFLEIEATIQMDIYNYFGAVVTNEALDLLHKFDVEDREAELSGIVVCFRTPAELRAEYFNKLMKASSVMRASL